MERWTPIFQIWRDVDKGQTPSPGRTTRKDTLFPVLCWRAMSQRMRRPRGAPACDWRTGWARVTCQRSSQLSVGSRNLAAITASRTDCHRRDVHRGGLLSLPRGLVTVARPRLRRGRALPVGCKRQMMRLRSPQMVMVRLRARLACDHSWKPDSCNIL